MSSYTDTKNNLVVFDIIFCCVQILGKQVFIYTNLVIALDLGFLKLFTKKHTLEKLKCYESL